MCCRKIPGMPIYVSTIPPVISLCSKGLIFNASMQLMKCCSLIVTPANFSFLVVLPVAVTSIQWCSVIFSQSNVISRHKYTQV